MSASIFSVLILLLSSFSGLVRGASPPTVELSGLGSLTIQVGEKATFHFNISGGLVDSTHPWTLYWFFSKTNATSISHTRQVISAAGTGCTLAQNCSNASVPGSMSVTYNETGTYDVSVTAYDSDFDYHILTAVVNVTDPVSMCATSTSNTAIIGTPVGFYALANSSTEPGNAFAYTWNFGDGNTSSGTFTQATVYCRGDAWKNTVSHAFAQPGTHLVTVTAVDMHGAATRSFVFVNVTDPGPMMANLSVPKNASAGASVNMSANATDPSLWDLGNLTFAWNFGDGTNWTISTPLLDCQAGACWDLDQVNHVYAKTGTYQVTAEVYNPEGNASLHPHSGRNAFLTANITVHQLRVPCPFCIPIGNTGIIKPICPPWNLSCLGVPWYSPLNETYVGPTGRTYGYAGIVSSWQYGTQTVNAYFNGSGSEQKTEQTISVTFNDTAPIVGVTGVYVAPTITLSLTGGGSPGAGRAPQSCLYTSIQVNLTGPDGSIAGANLPCGLNSVSLPVESLYLGNSYSVESDYQALGPSGSTAVQLSFAFPGNPTPVTYSWTFQNSNPMTWDWQVDAMAASLGQPTNVQTEVFSRADVALTVNWTYGDGGTYSTVVPAPVSPGPNLQTVTVVHTWANGRIYPFQVSVTDPVNGGQGGLSDLDSITITEVGDASASDTAPIPSLALPSFAFTGAYASMWDNATDVDQSVGIASESWGFGDGESSTGNFASHLYDYGGQYLVVATATSSGGSQGVAMGYVPVTNPPPVASLACSPTTAVVGQPVFFDASNSTFASPSLSYVWNFGDGTIVSGPSATARVFHTYFQPGTYVATVLVTDPDGRSATASCSIHVNSIGKSSPPTPGVTLANETVTAGQFSPFAVQLVGGLPATELAFLNVTWAWGGYGFLPSNSNGTHGIAQGHTYLFPGKYAMVANVFDPFFSGSQLVILTANATVVDPKPWVSLPYYDGTVYGENHTSNLTATALGTWGDYYSAGNWNFTFSWGDGSQSTRVSTFYSTALEGHTYTISGPANFVVSATTPELAAYAATGFTSDTLNLVADWDGDGLPNVYEQLISNTSIDYANTSLKEGATGWGLTDLLSALTDGKLGNLSADQDGDGLTDAQEIEGTVTGYFSNPLDPNTAGDGVPDGSHFFSDEFRATEVVPLQHTGTTSVVLPGVEYGGAVVGFNQSVLTVELSTTSSPSDFTLSVCPSGTTSCQSLGTPANLTPSYYLLNRTPIYGSSSAYSLALTNLQTLSNWTVEVTVKNGYNVAGNVTFAAIRDSYYTDPSLADPYHQGMLTVHTLMTPVFNCSAPENESYPVLNWSTPSLTYVNYWPYTEAYFKLSEAQGVPYVPGTNATMTAENNASSCQGLVSSSHFHDIATYLGDADFGISPWNAHAAGDPRLTNGMKALGKADYDATAWKYETESGAMATLPGTDPYPTDTYGVNEPLNPTALSTSGDGTPDSYAQDPIGPPVLDLTINHATDPKCQPTLTDQMGAFVVNGADQEVYTPQVNGTGGTNNSSCGTSGVGYTYDDHYVLPLDENSSTFSVELDLINDGGSTISKDASAFLNGSMSSSKVIWTPSGSAINASGQVAPMNRTQTILANTTQELLDLPGYGYRYQGDPQFYAFYVNSTVQVTQNGTTIYGSLTDPTLNVILESRQAFLNSTFGRDQANGSLPSGLGGITSLTVRNNTPSETGVAGTYTINLTSSAYGMTLLSSLLAKSWNGTKGTVIGAYTALNTSQVELLGLTTQSLELDPFAPTSTFDSPQGAVPTSGNHNSCSGFLCELAESLTSFVVGSLVALWNFGGTLVHAAVEFGQFVLGLFSHAAQAAKNAAEQAWNALKQLYDFVLHMATLLLEAITSPITSRISAYEFSLRSSLWTEVLAIRAHQPITNEMEETFWNNFTGGVFPFAVYALAAVLVVTTIVATFSLGAGFIIPLFTGQLLSSSDQALGAGMKILHLNPIAQGANIVPYIEAGVNSTFGHPSTNNGSGSHFSQNETFAASSPDWGSLVGDLFALSGAIILLGAILKGSAGGAVGEATAGVILSALALILDGVMLTNSSYCGLSVFGMILSFIGFGLGFNAYEGGSELPGEIAFATSSTAAVVSVYEYSKGC